MPELIIQNVSVLMHHDNDTSARYNGLHHNVEDDNILEFAEALGNIQTTTIEKITKRIVSEMIFI